MKVEYAELTDFDAWIRLAREVEPLFGPMADEVPFQEAIKQAMAQKTADVSSPDGRAARKLYLDFGFLDYKDGGLNPAGIPTVIMQFLPPS